MLVLTLNGLLAVFLTYLASIGKMKAGMKCGFFIVTFIAVIHYDYGVDYMSYYEEYLEFISYPYSLKDVLSGGMFKNNEFGWGLLMMLFKPIGSNGFFYLVAAISIIENCIYYHFIKKNVSQRWWAFAMFIYLFTVNFYPLSLSGLRQWLVIALFIGAYSLIQRKKIIPAMLIIFAGTTIHVSSLILLPFVFWGWLPVKKSKYLVYLFIALIGCLFFANNLLNSTFSQIIVFTKLGNNYDQYINVTKIKYGIGFLLNLIPFIVNLCYLFFNNNADDNFKRIVAISSIGTIIIPYGEIVPMISRITFYFSIFTIASIPITYSWIKNKSIRLALSSIFIFMTLYSYYEFFYDDIWINKYLHFHSLFELL